MDYTYHCRLPEDRGWEIYRISNTNKWRIQLFLYPEHTQAGRILSWYGGRILWGFDQETEAKAHAIAIQWKRDGIFPTKEFLEERESMKEEEYEYPDDTTCTKSYGALRRWAAECAEAKQWMLTHLPSEIFEKKEQFLFKLGYVYRMKSKYIRGKGSLCLLAANGHEEYVLTVLGGTDPGFTWGNAYSIEDLSTKYVKDLVSTVGSFKEPYVLATVCAEIAAARETV